MINTTDKDSAPPELMDPQSIARYLFQRFTDRELAATGVESLGSALKDLRRQTGKLRKEMAGLRVSQSSPRPVRGGR